MIEVKRSEIWWKGLNFFSMLEDIWLKIEIDVIFEVILEV